MKNYLFIPIFASVFSAAQEKEILPPSKPLKEFDSKNLQLPLIYQFVPNNKIVNNDNFVLKTKNPEQYYILNAFPQKATIPILNSKKIELELYSKPIAEEDIIKSKK